VPSTVRRRALAAWEAAGLRPIALHECRHTAASLLLAAGVGIKVVSAVMGHASVTITLDRYGHLLPDSVAEAGELLAARLERR
jgi:integrase